VRAENGVELGVRQDGHAKRLSEGAVRCRLSARPHEAGGGWPLSVPGSSGNLESWHSPS
jgi:hypothetical protein